MNCKTSLSLLTGLVVAFTTVGSVAAHEQRINTPLRAATKSATTSTSLNTIFTYQSQLKQNSTSTNQSIDSQSMNYPWSGEQLLGGSAKQLAAHANADGRLELFYVGTDDAIYHNYQTSPNGNWFGEQLLGGSAKQLAAHANADGRLELFYVGTDDAIYHNYQTSPNGNWSGEQPFEGRAKQVVIERNIDGRLEVFYVGTNNTIYHNYQVVLPVTATPTTAPTSTPAVTPTPLPSTKLYLPIVRR